MRLEKFTRDPVDQQAFGMASLNEVLKGAVHVETYTKDEGMCGGDKTIVIFAFYPDSKESRLVDKFHNARSPLCTQIVPDKQCLCNKCIREATE